MWGNYAKGGMKVVDLVKICDEWLQPANFKDYCVNGLQVSNSGAVGSTIASAVTASYDAISAAASHNAKILLVHHGIFWQGDELKVTGMFYNRLKLLMQNDMALIAYHLPLDEHNLYGNNVLLGEALGISAAEQQNLALMQPSLGRFADCNFEYPNLLDKLSLIMARAPQQMNFGPRKIRKIAWCTGAAQDGIIAAHKVGADTYISGEVSERTYHYAKELAMNYFCVGHHASERFGVKALGDTLAKKYCLNHEYIEIDNPV